MIRFFKIVFSVVMLFLCSVSSGFSQNCTVNAGGNTIICASTTTLNGSVSGQYYSGRTWTFISGPVTPTIVTPNNLVTQVTGMTVNGDYVFELSNVCSLGVATSRVTITAHPRPASFTAGPDITNVCATVGTTTLGGVIPAGFTGYWRSVNIYRSVRSAVTSDTNSVLSSRTVGNPTLSLINKANHQIDPAYYAILTITSLDSVCTYVDTAIVRFVPNPIIVTPDTTKVCADPSAPNAWIDFVSPTSPSFSTAYAGSAGTLANGTTVSLTILEQPVGANLQYQSIENRRFYFTGAHVPGQYRFTITVSNTCGTYTSPEVVYVFGGTLPIRASFVDAAYPEQMMIYDASNSGGEVHCQSRVNSNTPEVFHFKVNPADPPTVITTVTSSGIMPPTGAPSGITVSGAGTYNRTATVSPPPGGWSVGTYKFTVVTSNGVCSVAQSYYIHISDNSRPNVEIQDVAVCYPGNGAISATVALPARYKGIVNTSYFQDYDPRYEFTTVSRPSGSSTLPVFEAANLRNLTRTSTVISNLDAVGTYVFRVELKNYTTSVGPFLNQEYSCSGSSFIDTFRVYVEPLVNANAGSDQTGVCAQSVMLLGNNPSPSSGVWTLVSAPTGALPVINGATNFSTNAGFLDSIGSYRFAWTITSARGACVSSDMVDFGVVCRVPTHITISGTIHHDANGMTGGVNGPVMQGVTVTLFAPDGVTVIATTTSDASGNYSFPNLPYSLEDYVVAVTAPTGYAHASSTGATPTSGRTSVNGKTNATGVSFGLQQPPSSDPKQFLVANSDFSYTPPARFPGQVGYKSIALNSNALTGYTTGGSLTGRDPEDCPGAGACHSGTGSTFSINSINANTRLFYDFGGATAVEINLSSGPVSIPNFDASKLVVYGQTGSGDVGNGVGFTYALVDAAGLASATATYLIEVTTPLPITLVSFAAKKENTSVNLEWQTASEKENEGFEIQKSADSRNWSTIGYVKSQAENGTSSFTLNYQSEDNTPWDGNNYYRLKQIDNNGSFAYSVIRLISYSNSESVISIYPNPTTGKVNIKGLKGNSYIKVIDNVGKVVYSVYANNDSSNETIDLSKLPNGLYFINVIDENGHVTVDKIQKL